MEPLLQANALIRAFSADRRQVFVTGLHQIEKALFGKLATLAKQERTNNRKRNRPGCEYERDGIRERLRNGQEAADHHQKQYQEKHTSDERKFLSHQRIPAK